jgi:tetratricopeptide (TPR) repeat protein
MDNASVFFISMEGRSDFRIGNFKVREDIPLPVYVEDEKKFSVDNINPDNIISGMIKILMEDSQNDHLEYYREFIFTVQPEIEARLSSIGYDAEKNMKFQDAIDIYRVLLALKPDSINSNLNLAICYDEFSQYLFSHGRENEALKMEELSFDFFKIVENFDDKPDNAYYYLGRFFLYRENYQKARENLEEFIRNTDDEERKKEAGEILTDINNSGMMDENYKSSMEMITADKNEAAVDYINRYIEKYPDSWHGYYIKGQALRKMENFKDAVDIFNKALSLNPDSSDIYNEIGLCHMDLKDFAKSELNFYRALKKNPEDLAILTNLAILNFRRGNKTEAVKYCDIILEYDPNDLYAKDLKKVIEET